MLPNEAQVDCFAHDSQDANCFYKEKSKVFDPITRSLSKDKDISMQMFIIVLFIMVRN